MLNLDLLTESIPYPYTSSGNSVAESNDLIGQFAMPGMGNESRGGGVDMATLLGTERLRGAGMSSGSAASSLSTAFPAVLASFCLRLSFVTDMVTDHSCDLGMP